MTYRLSKWAAPSLSRDQIQYAARDSYASITVYESIIAKPTPFDPTPITKADLSHGQEVVLLSKGKPEVVARGTVVLPTNVPDSRVWATSNGRKTLVNKNRVEVKLDRVLVDGASLQFVDSTGQADKAKLKDLGSGASVLWGVSCIRRPSPDPTVAPPDIETEQPPNGPGSSDAWTDGEELDRAVQEAVLRGETVDYASPDGDEEEDQEEGISFDCHGVERSGGATPNLGIPGGCVCHGPHVKLDLLHAQRRVTVVLSKSHGATAFATVRLRDLFSSPDPEDIAAVKKVKMRDEGMDEKDWKQYLKENYRDVLKYCKRVIPPPAVLLDRMDKFEALYPNIRDAATGKPLFNEEAWKRWRALKEHVARGCLSDPDPSYVNLYYTIGTRKNGLPIYACSRGTSQLEGYHQKLRDIIAAWICSPRMAESILKEFNFRWNLAMAVKYCHLPKDCSGFYEQILIEQIQDITQGWYPSPLFKDWRSTR